jgi:antitoxin component of RelBE/YafQ-DinJ toxin-antitoxin module
MQKMSTIAVRVEPRIKNEVAKMVNNKYGLDLGTLLKTIVYQIYDKKSVPLKFEFDDSDEDIMAFTRKVSRKALNEAW